jgi:hypothetical protein
MLELCDSLTNTVKLRLLALCIKINAVCPSAAIIPETSERISMKFGIGGQDLL